MPGADEERASATLPAVLRWGLYAACVGAMGLVALVVAQRVGYPYELEWLEGAVWQHVREVQAGRSVYAAPSARFSPFYYTPLYYYVSAAAMRGFGEDFLGMRIVSLAGSSAALVAVYAFVRHETRQRLAGWLASAVLASAYWWTGRWFEVGRIDGLFLGLVLGGAYALRALPGRVGSVAAGGLFAAAVLTKQTALLVALPLLGWAAWRRRDWGAAASFGSVVAVVLLVLDTRSDGWLRYCLFELTRGHPLITPRIGTFWTHDVLATLPFALALIGLGLFEQRARSDGFYPALAAGMFAAAYLPRIKLGGYDNNLLPVFAVVAVGVGLAFAALTRIGATRNRAFAAVALVLAQLAWLLPRDDPWAYVPGEEDRAAGDALVDLLKAARGDVLVPAAPYLAARAGKPVTAHQMNLMDLVWADVPERAGVLGTFREALERGDYALVVLNNARGEWLVPLPPRYAYQGRVFAPGTFTPTSGTSDFVPAHIYVRRR